MFHEKKENKKKKKKIILTPTLQLSSSGMTFSLLLVAVAFYLEVGITKPSFSFSKLVVINIYIYI